MKHEENILLMMPSFMGYDKALVTTLMKYGKVTYFNNEAHLEDLEKKFQKSLYRKLLRRLCSLLDKKQYLYEFFLKEYEKKDLSILLSEHYSIIININGCYVTDKIYKQLKKYNKNAHMILYWWDDAMNLQKRNYQRFFSKKFSYCIDDCEKYGFEYLQMFTPVGDIILSQEKQYDIAIIGTAHPDRVELVKKIYIKYKEKYNFYIYFYHPKQKVDFFGHNVPLSFREYLVILSKSKAVMDLPFENQIGPTTRPFDALLTNTKVITTNKLINKYPIYSENIMIIDKENPIISSMFINLPYIKNEYRYLKTDDWIKKIWNSIEN